MSDRITLHEAAQLLRDHGLDLYDFGVGVTCVPQHSGDGWLTTSCAFVFRPHATLKGAIEYLCLDIAPDLEKPRDADGHARVTRRMIERAIRLFPQLARVTGTGGDHVLRNNERLTENGFIGPVEHV